MCLITKNIQLCTCEDIVDFEAIENRWELYRKRDDIFIMGSFVRDSVNIEKMNSREIAKNLNAKECFDFAYSPEEKDVLKIWITIKGKEQIHEFIFKNREWIATELDLVLDTFSWMEDGGYSPYIGFNQGIINNVMK